MCAAAKLLTELWWVERQRRAAVQPRHFGHVLPCVLLLGTRGIKRRSSQEEEGVVEPFPSV